MQAIAQVSGLPGPFMKFIGTAEALGAFGLFVPGLLRRLPVLTVLAASGLVIIMVGATTMTLLQGSVPAALFPFVVGVLAGTVARGRGHRSQPHRTSAAQVLQSTT